MDLNFFTMMKSELVLTGLIFIFMFAKLGSFADNGKRLLMLANILLIINFAAGFFMNKAGVLFSGMFYTNDIIALEKNILNLALLLISFLSYDWLEKNKNAAEFYMLLLSAQLGMFFLLSSGNFLMFFLGMELATIPLAALTNFDLDRPRSSEAGFKMIMSSAFASAIMLFGISLLYGTTGTLDFSEMHSQISMSHLQVLAFVFVFVGIAFKLSLVPFHLWTADVYEGSPVSITASLAVISKGAFIFVFMSTLFTVFSNFFMAWDKMVMISIMVTITIGNFQAVRPSNLKRLLAFSSISQVGYLLLGVIAFSSMGESSVVYFMLIYVFSSLAMFAVVSQVVNQTGKEEISEYRGFYQNNKLLSWVIALALFSLAGIPPTAGFFGKYFLLTAGAAKGDYVLLSVAVLNMVVSLYYYLRVIKAVFIEKSEDGPVQRITVSPMVSIAIVVCIAGILAIGFAGEIFEFISSHFTSAAH
jgi:NADH-quinone oxidoreductase subunit N